MKFSDIFLKTSIYCGSLKTTAYIDATEKRLTHVRMNQSLIKYIGTVNLVCCCFKFWDFD